MRFLSEAGSDLYRAGGATVVSPALQRGEWGNKVPVSHEIVTRISSMRLPCTRYTRHLSSGVTFDILNRFTPCGGGEIGRRTSLRC